MEEILSFDEFTNRSLKEALDPFIGSGKKFKVGQSVKLGKRIGKIVSIQGGLCNVLFGSDQRKCKESELSELKSNVGPVKKLTRKKRPKERSLGITEE